MVEQIYKPWITYTAGSLMILGGIVGYFMGQEPAQCWAFITAGMGLIGLRRAM